MYWIDATIVRGDMLSITSEKPIIGPVEFVPMPDGTALLMLPITKLLEKNEENRKGNIMEVGPLSKMDQRLRTVLALSRKEAFKVLQMKEGDEIVFTRTGWGREWKQRLDCRPHQSPKEDRCTTGV